MSDFFITSKCATDLAQMVHNNTEENGEINQDKIIDILVEQLGEEIGNWLEGNIDWDKILDDDRETRDFIKERNEAMRGEY